MCERESVCMMEADFVGDIYSGVSAFSFLVMRFFLYSVHNLEYICSMFETFSNGDLLRINLDFNDVWQGDRKKNGEGHCLESLWKRQNAALSTEMKPNFQHKYPHIHIFRFCRDFGSVGRV